MFLNDANVAVVVFVVAFLLSLPLMPLFFKKQRARVVAAVIVIIVVIFSPLIVVVFCAHAIYKDLSKKFVYVREFKRVVFPKHTRATL